MGYVWLMLWKWYVAKVISAMNSVDTVTLQTDEAILSSAESSIIEILIRPQEAHTPTRNSLEVNR